MYVLALSLGAATGFAFGDLGSQVSGTWPADGSLATRLAQVEAITPPQRVVYVEDGTAAAADVATLQEWAAGLGAPCSAITFAEAACAWSGKPAASPEDMIALAKDGDGIKARTGSQALAVAAFLAT